TQGSDFCISKHEPMTCRYFRQHKVDSQKESGEECKTNVSYDDESLSHIRPRQLVMSYREIAPNRVSLRNFLMFQWEEFVRSSSARVCQLGFRSPWGRVSSMPVRTDGRARPCGDGCNRQCNSSGDSDGSLHLSLPCADSVRSLGCKLKKERGCSL